MQRPPQAAYTTGAAGAVGSNAPLPRPSLSVSVWLLRNSVPLVPAGATPAPAAVAAGAASHWATGGAAAVECSEPGDLLYGCENDLLDTGTTPLTWGPQPSLHHVAAPRYFTGEALTALVAVRNTSNVVAAPQVRVRVELVEAAQRRTAELLSVTIASLAPNATAEYRVFTRILEAGAYSLTARAACGPEPPAAASIIVSNSSDAALSASAVRTVAIECDRGVEEAARRVVPVPITGSAGGGGGGGGSTGASRFLVMFSLRNASTANPAALQHVALISKDALVTVVAVGASPGDALNAPDAHMTELLRVPVVTGASAASCVDSVMAPGEVRQFTWFVDVAAAGGAASSVSAAAALALMSRGASGGAVPSAAGGGAAVPSGNLGVVEWQWRRSGGDGGAIRSTMITTTGAATATVAGGTLVAAASAPSSSLLASSSSTTGGELFVEPRGVDPSPCVAGAACELTYAVTNRTMVAVELAAHVDAAALLPEFLFTGGSASISLGTLEAQATAVLRVPVVALQSGAFYADAAFQLRDAAPPYLPRWSATRAGGASATRTNVISMLVA